MKFLLTLLILLATSTVSAYQQLDIELSSGTEMNLSHFPADSKTLLLWIPSEYGLANGHIPVALGLADHDYDVWVANLHDSYMLSPGRQSLDAVDVADLLDLIGIARKRGYQRIYFISSNRGAQLALKLSYLWQQRHGKGDFIGGLLLFSPHLVKGRTELGQSAEYVDIASYSNLPVYMLQAQHSTKYAHSWEIAGQLQKGGSPVFIQFIQGVQGGFQARPDSDLTELDISKRGELGEILAQAVTLLDGVTAAPLAVGFEQKSVGDNVTSRRRTSVLQRFNGDKTPPELVLNDLNSSPYDLRRDRGEVILINFWATWCGPCIEEIPSLSRLVKHLRGKPFKVKAVNIGESPQAIREFLQSVPVNFDILLDSKGQTVRDWKVYAYPSNFLIDREGKIQYAYRGALQWDSSEVINIIESLF